MRDSTSLSLVKIFLKIPVLAKINTRKQFVKINPRKIFLGQHSGKLIHTKFNPCKVYSLVLLIFKNIASKFIYTQILNHPRVKTLSV